MRIAYNPKTAQALMSAPNNEDITFDLSGLAIYVKGVKFEGKAYSVFKKHTLNTTGGYDGLVPAPSYTETTERYLREDGTWVVPTNTNYYRPISVNGTSILGNNNTALNLVAGTNISITAENSSGYTGKVTITNTGVRSVTTGTTNGTISVNTNGTTANVAVKGLDTAAYTKSSEYIRQVNLGKKLVDVKDIWTNLELYWGNARSVIAQLMDDSGHWGHLFFKSQNPRLSEYGVDAAGLFMRGGMFQRWTFSGKDTEEDPLVLNKYKIYDESNLTVVSSSDNGLTPKVINTNTATVGSAYYVLASTNGSASPSWYKLPSNAFANDDTKVTQTNTTSSAYYRVLLSGNANDTTETTTARKSTNLLFNPSTGRLKSKYILTEGILSSVASDLETLSKSGNNLIYNRFSKTIFTNETGITVTGNANGVLWVGTHSPEASNDTEVGYGHMLGFTGGTGGLYHKIVVNGDLSQSWKQIAYTTSDITGNAATADKLKTKRKLWGLDFDGSADVSGNMTGVGVINKVFKVRSTQDIAQLNVSEELSTINYSHLYVSSNNTANSNSRPLVLQNGYGNVGIGVIAPSEKLEVNGNVRATSFIGNLDGTYVNKLTGYSKATTIAALAATDSLNTALGKLEYKADTACNWITTVTAEDTDKLVNKWGEIVDFLDSVAEGTDITDEFVTRKTDLTITGIKTFQSSAASSTTTIKNGLILINANTYGGWTRGMTLSNTDTNASGETTTVSATIGVFGSGCRPQHTGNNKIDYLYMSHLGLEYYDAVFKVYSNKATISGNEIYHKGNLKNLSDLNDDIVSGKYLPLTGGTLTGNISAPAYLLGNGKGTYIDSGADNTLVFYDNTARRTVIHSGNISLQNVAGAYKLISLYVGDLNGAEADRFFRSGFQASNRPSHHNYATGISLYNSELKYKYQLTFDTYGTLYTRYLNSSNTWSGWNQIASIADIPTSLKNPNALTLQAGAFSAKTYDGSAAVTVNIPTHTSHLTNNSGFLTSHQSLANYVTLNTDQVVSGQKLFNNQLIIRKDVGNTGTSVTDQQHKLLLQVMRYSDTHSVAIGVMPNGSGVIWAKANGIGYNTLYLNPHSNGVAIGTEDKTLPALNDGYYFHIFGATLSNSSITAAGFIKSGSSDSYVLLGGGGHKALSDFLLETEFASKELSSNLTTITKSLKLTKDWKETGISLNPTNFPDGAGTYAIQVTLYDGNQGFWDCYFSGIMSVYTSYTNAFVPDDEIILHHSSHACSKQIYLKTKPTVGSNDYNKLYIACNTDCSSAINITFKFKKLI